MVNSSLSKTLINCIYEKEEIIFYDYNDSLKHFASFAIDISLKDFSQQQGIINLS